MADDKEPSWQEQLLLGVGVLVIVGVLVGVILAVIAVKAADVAGVGGVSSTSSPGPILPTTGSPPATKSPTGTGDSSTVPSGPTTTHHRPPQVFRLTASPTSGSTYQRINLTGSYAGHDGATLQVQQSNGGSGWVDFPVTAHVNAGTFSTYIETGHTGLNHFRMVDTAAGKASNAVAVTIH